MYNKDYISLKKDTITAISSPLGVGAISIIRISGKNSLNIISKFFFNKKGRILKNRINLGIIKEKNNIIDQVIILYFKKPNSYTGEDLIEINCHGSIYIQNKIIKLIINNGARLAVNGEFTYRAFINKKITLLQAESILDIINSKNKIEHQIAINNLLNNKLYRIIQKNEKKLFNIISYIEINLDFLDIKYDVKNIFKKILIIRKNIKKIVKNFKTNSLINSGIFISIVGPVNSGKSTLMNKIINEDKSIISNIPGTTRDIVEGKILINNFNFSFFDTAGIRKSKFKIEKIGIKKTLENIKNTNLIFYVFDYILLINKNIKKNIKKIQKTNKYKSEIILIANKIDKYKNIIKKKYIKINNIKYKILYISAKKNIGLNKITNYLKSKIPNKMLLNSYFTNNDRHYRELKLAHKYINKVVRDYNYGVSLELLSIDLRNAIKHLYKITGKIFNNDDILKNIFSKFCVGK